MTAEGKLRRANAVLGTVHQLFEHAIKWKICTDNPAKRIQRNPEHNRERYLSEAETERLLATLDRWQERCPDSVDIIRLLMLTGARRGEVVGMTWEQLDLDAGVWSKPYQTTKQRKPHRVPLSPQAIELLRQRRASRVVRLRDDRVFPSDSVVHRLEREWYQIRAAAGLEDVRLHDLRHSFASMLVAQGLSLPIIGAMLGHSKPATTAH
jgi:integrase